MNPWGVEPGQWCRLAPVDHRATPFRQFVGCVEDDRYEGCLRVEFADGSFEYWRERSPVQRYDVNPNGAWEL